MNCGQVRKLIEDYHYGELEERRAAEVAAHLQGCAACSSELELLDREARLYESYRVKSEGGLHLPEDLWMRAMDQDGSAVRGRSGEPGRQLGPAFRDMLVSRPWIRQALAAAVLVAISVSATLFFAKRYGTTPTEVSSVSRSAQGETGDRSLEDALSAIRQAEADYIRAIQALSAIVERQKPTLDPGILQELQAKLKVLDEHIAAAREAYYAHPADPDLALFMLAAYGRKVELLQNLTS
jgi:hypothetical protein